MARLLYLVHRLPYPPNKGDKVRSYHLLRHLLDAGHEVHLGTFVDDPEDEAHVQTLRGWCASVHAVRLHPRRAKLRSLAGLASGQALTLHYYRNASLARWVQARVRAGEVDAAVVFSSSMAQYAEGLGVPMIVDFVDIDSAKWTEYARSHPGPLGWLYRREGERLLAYERATALRSQHSFFATEKEAELFCRLAPECAAVVEPMNNGVDARFFQHDAARPSPFAADERPIVFTGAMDYWPNIDAVTWFAQEALPALRRRWPAARLHIVGRAPAPAVRALAADDVHVSGTVPDVRPYLQHADVVVAPLRLARGIQNKVLEAMAMGRPVVVASGCAAAIHARPGEELVTAASAEDFAREVGELLAAPERAAAIGRAGRECVLRNYAWDAHLAAIDRHLQREPAVAA